MLLEVYTLTEAHIGGLIVVFFVVQVIWMFVYGSAKDQISSLTQELKTIVENSNEVFSTNKKIRHALTANMEAMKTLEKSYHERGVEVDRLGALVAERNAIISEKNMQIYEVELARDKMIKSYNLMGLKLNKANSTSREWRSKYLGVQNSVNAAMRYVPQELKELDFTLARIIQTMAEEYGITNAQIFKSVTESIVYLMTLERGDSNQVYEDGVIAFFGGYPVFSIIEPKKYFSDEQYFKKLKVAEEHLSFGFDHAVVFRVGIPSSIIVPDGDTFKSSHVSNYIGAPNLYP